MRRVVISLHGINTRGAWQKELAPILALKGFIPYALDYGYFLLRFARRGARQKMVEWLRDQVQRVKTEARTERPSIIAHSFGTYLVAGLVEKYRSIHFDKVILCGGIVRRDYDWETPLSSGQINLVRNDYGRLDRWPRLAPHIVADAGPSGSEGFEGSWNEEGDSRRLQCQFPLHLHSDYFHRDHFLEYWIPTLRRPLFSRDEQRQLCALLQLAVVFASNELSVPMDMLRSNIFLATGGGRLEIPEGLHHNMADESERRIVIRSGEGCTGAAFKERKPIIGVKREGRGWGAHDLPLETRGRLDRELQWVYSIPVPDPDSPGMVLGTLSVDGLRERKTPEALGAGKLVDRLKTVAQGVSRLLSRFR